MSQNQNFFNCTYNHCLLVFITKNHLSTELLTWSPPLFTQHHPLTTSSRLSADAFHGLLPTYNHSAFCRFILILIMQRTSKQLSPWNLPQDINDDPIPEITHPFFHSPLPAPRKPRRKHKHSLRKNHTEILKKQKTPSPSPRKVTINYTPQEQVIREKSPRPRESVKVCKIGVETLVRENSQFVVGLKQSQQALLEMRDMLDDLLVLKMVREQLKREKVQGTSERINEQFEVLFPLIGMAAGNVPRKRRRGMSEVVIRRIQ